jgi:hypothetical protein
MPQHKLRWRDYKSVNGVRPVEAFIETLTDEEAAAVIASMKDVAERGLRVARHIRAEIYEVRVDAVGAHFGSSSRRKRNSSSWL